MDITTRKERPKHSSGLAFSFQPLCFVVSVVSCIVVSFHRKNIPLWYFRVKGKLVAVDRPVPMEFGKSEREIYTWLPLYLVH